MCLHSYTSIKTCTYSSSAGASRTASRSTEAGGGAGGASSRRRGRGALRPRRSMRSLARTGKVARMRAQPAVYLKWPCAVREKNKFTQFKWAATRNSHQSVRCRLVLFFDHGITGNNLKCEIKLILLPMKLQARQPLLPLRRCR